MKKNKKEFSKSLLIQESVLIWITTLFCLGLGSYCIYQQYLGSLPWISSIIVSAWTAYGVSQAMYYRKSMAENTNGGVKYESVISEIEQARNLYSNVGESAEADISSFFTSGTSTTTYYSSDEDPDNYQI